MFELYFLNIDFKVVGRKNIQSFGTFQAKNTETTINQTQRIPQETVEYKKSHQDIYFYCSNKTRMRLVERTVNFDVFFSFSNVITENDKL